VGENGEREEKKKIKKRWQRKEGGKKERVGRKGVIRRKEGSKKKVGRE
jgi:hypothetical protein